MFGFLKHKKEKKIILKAPFDGKIINMEKVPDKVFAQNIVGYGVAIKPSSSLIISPIEGKILQVFPTLHALGIETDEGLEVLVHLGIETVNLQGKGFTCLVKKGQKVKSGDKLMKVDWPFVEKNAVSTISPIIITNKERIKEIKILNKNRIKAGQDIIMAILN